MSEENLDRFARAELSAEESRELAGKALDTPELFEELTYTAIARTAIADRRPRNKVWPRLAAVAAAIVIGTISLFLFRPSRTTPAVELPGPPIFLSHGASAIQFRGAEPDSRAARATGLVTSIVDGMVSIDLGSLDGLAKNGEVDVVREGKTIGTIKLTTLFREQARGEAAPGLMVRLTDQIRVPAPQYLRAQLDRIATLAAEGDEEGARRAASQVATGENLDIASPGYDDWNNLGGIAELHGDRDKARSLYEQALSANPPQDARRAIEANLERVKTAK